MAFLTVEGIDKDGKVELSEQPRLVKNSTQVLVSFLLTTEVQSWEKPDLDEPRRRAFEQMRVGIDLGEPPYPSHEAVHDRVCSRYSVPD